MTRLVFTDCLCKGAWLDGRLQDGEQHHGDPTGGHRLGVERRRGRERDDGGRGGLHEPLSEPRRPPSQVTETRRSPRLRVRRERDGPSGEEVKCGYCEATGRPHEPIACRSGLSTQGRVPADHAAGRAAGEEDARGGGGGQDCLPREARGSGEEAGAATEGEAAAEAQAREEEAEEGGAA